MPGLLALVFLEYVRPQEYVPILFSLPLLHVAAALAAAGFLVDLRLGVSRLETVPHLVLAIAFFAWCAVSLLVRAPADLPRLQGLATTIIIYVLVAHCVQSFRMLQVLCAVLLAICIGIGAIGVHQAFAPYGCHRFEYRSWGTTLVHDGRPCSVTDRNTCDNEDAEPGADYVCEKVGLLGTQSDHGRVRYRGTLQDPNELALVLGIALPFAFAFLDRRRTVPRLLLVIATCVVVGMCAYFTRSRGGQLVFLVTLGVYFIRRFGAGHGAVTAAILAVPIIAIGGRSGAESSTMERLECWWTGMHLVAASPGFGVGFGQFVEHHYITAHNSFILATAELGLPGMLLWTAILYIAIKIPAQALRSEVQPVARSWAIAVLAAMIGLSVGSFFLSYAYKTIWWLYVGATGVLYQAIRRHDPEFRVRFGLRDLLMLVSVDAALLFALTGYTAVKLGW